MSRRFWRARGAQWALLAVACALLSNPVASLAQVAPSPSAPSQLTPPLSIEDFFKDPAFSSGKLSPDGHRMALISRSGDTTAVGIFDLVKGGTSPVLTTNDKNFSFDWVSWKTEKRLIVGATYLNLVRWGGKEDGEILSYSYGKMIVAVDDDGGHQTTLLKTDKKQARNSGNVVALLDILEKDPGHVLVTADDNQDRWTVWRVDMVTGVAEPIERGTDSTFSWVTDVDGDVVVRIEVRGSNLIIQGRPPGGGWTEIVRLRAKDLQKELADFQILGAGEQPATLLVAVKPKDPASGKARSIHLYDVRTHSLGPPVWPALNYDVADVVQDPRTRSLEGVCYWVDIYVCDFKDPDIQKNIRAISKYFKDDRNLTPVSISDDGRYWLFAVSGPDEGASYYYYDWTKHQIRFLTARFPDLKSGRLGAMQRFTYAASDGMKIPAYVTRPPGAPKGPLPMVVLPHGGPEARDTFDFDTLAQVLATRGYLVFQPNFRGSGGYGVAYADAGHGQWGARMQADVTDGVRRLIADGQVDPARICIVGASYGGYSALIGGAQNPDLYKCVVSWSGVSDLTTMLKWERSQGGGEKSELFQYWQKSIGDPEDDKVKLAAVSPITYANTYVPPVLLIHGVQDGVVPVAQSRNMERALKAAGKTVTLKLYKDEGHSGWESKNDKSAMTEIAAFLATYIPPASSP